ncbi:MAG: ATP-binding protein [Polyangiales bacterium]
MSEHRADDIGRVLGLVVHDLRNPTATLGANLSFLEELDVSRLDPDAADAVEDMKVAMGDLRQGLDQVAWISRWLAGEQAVSPVDGDVAITITKPPEQLDDLDVTVEPPDDKPMRARGGGSTLARLLHVLLLNVRQHAAKGGATVRARREGDEVVVELQDSGSSIAGELATEAFDLSGQPKLKSRADGRYGRVAGLLAARALADAMDARLEATNEGGQATFRIRLQPL